MICLAPAKSHGNLIRPYVVLKIATSLDGRVACEDKTSQWITQAWKALLSIGSHK